MTIHTYKLIVAGLGNVGRNFAALLQSQSELLRQRYGIAFLLVGAADSRGAASDPRGLDLDALLSAKRAGQSVATLPNGQPGRSGFDLARTLEADVLLEATPVDLQHGQPGLDIVRAALGRGMAAVLANKGPLALAYQELAALGIRTVIDLQDDPTSYEKRDVEALGMKYINIPMSDKDYPESAKIEQFLKLVNDPSTGKFFVHCAGGRHRAGPAQGHLPAARP